MRKEALFKLCGSLEQLATARPVEFRDGKADGLKGILVQNGPLETLLMESKCLDPAWLRYKGINLSYLSKPGLQGKSPLETDPIQSGRSMMIGGMMTCGLENIHGGLTVNGSFYPAHGRIRSTAAEKVCADAAFTEEGYTLTVSGEMREAALFGENMLLRRTVRTVLGSAKLEFTDVIENQAFRPEPLCFLYHINFGYPFLVPGARILIPSLECTPRDENARAGVDRRKVMGEPKDNVPEQVFLHRCAADAQGNTLSAIVNDEMGLAVCVRWNVNEIPLLTHWKSEASGDFVTALEPCNTGFGQRPDAGKILEPFESYVNHYTIEVLEGPDALRALEAEYEALMQ